MGRRRPETLADSLGDALSRGEPFRRKLSLGGQLHIDRKLPFLFVYRQPPDDEDAATERLIRAEASFLIASGSSDHRAEVSATVRDVVSVLGAEFGATLVVEIYARVEDEAEEFAADWRPSFKVSVPEDAPAAGTVEVLESHLRKIRIFRKSAEVEVERVERIAPRGLPPLLNPTERAELNCSVVGLEVLPVYRDAESGVFPLAVRALRRQLSHALRRSVHRFAVARTGRAPASYLAFGRRRLTKAVLEVDQRLADISDSFDFLLHVTPVNVESAWLAFEESGFERAPEFVYRPLAVDPILLKRKLFGIPMEKIADPALEQLFRDKQLELDRQLTMFLDRGSRRFLYGSLQVYGPVSDDLVTLAEEILCRVPAESDDGARYERLGAVAIAERARAELDRYRVDDPALSSTVEIREDVFSVMVSSGQLLVGKTASIPEPRINAVLQHEVGTHIVTHVNGRAQPLRILYNGLAGYDELQEGLAVLAEFLVGGLTADRVRVLAARVISARNLIEGVSFIETFSQLCEKYRFPRKRAFQLALRIYRGGGLTKDAVYLRGFAGIIDYVKSEPTLDDLLLGKIATRYVSVMSELKLRGVLAPLRLRPRYLDEPDCLRRLEAIRNGATVLEIVGQVARRGS